MTRPADAILAACLLFLFAPQTAGAQPIPLAATGSAAQGELLFTGRAHFRTGGPACVVCHSVAGLPFTDGGTLGPDLTRAYRKLGPAGTQAAMQTLYFRVMTQIYGPRPLYTQEQADLVAFLERSSSRPQSRWNTQIILLVAVVLGAIFVAIMGFAWRDRVRSVRRAMVDRATGQGARL